MRNGLKALLVCTVMAIVWSNTGVGAAPPVTRAFSTGKFALEIDGKFVGFVDSVEGGLPFGDVVKEAGDDFFVKKHLGNAGYRDIRLEFGADMDRSFYEWIASSLRGNHMRKDGAIHVADYDNKIISEMKFFHALITEFGMPALDAASKDPAKLTIVLSPEQTTLDRKASGKLSLKGTGPQKPWLSSSFRLSIDGVDTKRVSKVDALTVKFPRSTDCIHCKELAAGPTQVDFPNLVVTMSEPAESVHDWFEQFVIEGNNDDSQEKGGTLEYLTPDLKTVLFTLKFRNLGIFELMPVVQDAGGNQLPKLLAAMYCETMEFLVP